MKLLEKVRETTKVLKTLSRKPRRPVPKKLQARVRAATTANVDDYEEDEPQTKLTSAFIVVLILHIVAVGGIYAFNQIKASRRTIDVPSSSTSKPQHNAITQVPTSNSDAAEATSVVTTSTNVAAPSAAAAKIQQYTVKSGDTLHGISKATGASVADLKSANGLTNDNIRVGQTLDMPWAKATTVAFTPAATPQPTKVTPAVDNKPTTPSTKTYTVKSGDRLIFIAKRFNVTQEDIVALNKIKDPTKLQIGQNLKIPVKK